MANTFDRYTSRGIGTAPTAIGNYYVPAATKVTVIGLTVCNKNNGAIKVDVMLNDGTNDNYIVKGADIATGGALVLCGGDQKLVMKTSDSIKVVSNTASSVDAIMSTLEMS